VLFWHQISNELTVSVSDERSGSYFELTAEPDHALDVFSHRTRTGVTRLAVRRSLPPVLGRWSLTMSSIPSENATEIRLDYHDISAGQLVIVMEQTQFGTRFRRSGESRLAGTGFGDTLTSRSDPADFN
jgi:hypothetical protein